MAEMLFTMPWCTSHHTRSNYPVLAYCNSSGYTNDVRVFLKLAGFLFNYLTSDVVVRTYLPRLPEARLGATRKPPD